MERVLTLLVASTCIAVFFFWLGALIVERLTKDAGGGSDQQIAYGYFMILAGLALAAIGFFLTWYLAQRFLVHDFLRYLQLADGIGVVGLLIAWQMNTPQQPQRLQYDGRWAALEIEVRATKSLLAGESISSVISVDYSGGQSSGNFERPNAVREEGAFMILPWATAPSNVRKWEVRVFLTGKPVLFPLDLPRYPTQSTDWSTWGKPVLYQDQIIPDSVRQGLSARYRIRLVPSTEDYQ